MKVEFLKGLGLEDEVIAKIQAENGKEVEREKDKTKEFEKQLQAVNEARTALQSEIGELKKEDPSVLKERISELEKQIEARKAEDEKAVYEKNMAERFENVLGESKFVNELTKKGIFAEFKAAVEDKNNKGKGDNDIYALLTKDREGIFACENPSVDIPGTGKDVADQIEDSEIRAIMGLSQQK